MSETSVLHQRLQRSQESRIRAWNALQELRQVLSRVSTYELQPTIKPPCFKREGEVLRRALVDVLLQLHQDIEDLEKAIERIRPFIGTANTDASLPHALIQLNRAMAKPRWSATDLMRMR
jgi:hypothetical protein